MPRGRPRSNPKIHNEINTDFEKLKKENIKGNRTKVIGRIKANYNEIYKRLREKEKKLKEVKSNLAKINRDINTITKKIKP